MSHEIRTPMNGIIGMLTLAENKLEANSPAMQYLTKADELRISQVIIYFLSNAVKFTSEGEIIVTFRQMMLQNGVDVRAVQEVLGHEHLNTTEIYTHIDNEALRVAAKANPLTHVKMKGKIEDKTPEE